MASAPARYPYELLKPRLLRIARDSDRSRPSYVLDEETGIYRRPIERGSGTAVISCGGMFRYNATIGAWGLTGNTCDFFPCVRFLCPVFEDSDLNIASLCSAVSDEYLPSEMVEDENYWNARPELLTAVRRVGIDCLAAANPHLIDVGAGGIDRTLANIAGAGIVPGGIGGDKYPLFEVNGIRIGVLNYTLQCMGVDRFISKKGADVQIGLFKPKSLKADVETMRERGADFILTYINGEPGDTDLTGKERAAAARKAAEAGADYVVCTGKSLVGKYWKYETQDGRRVPLATAVSNLLSGRILDDLASVVVRMTIRKDADGKITCEDAFIPLKHTEGRFMNPIVPAVRGLYPFYDEEDFEACLALIRMKTEDRIPIITDLHADKDDFISRWGYDIFFDRTSVTEDAMAQAIRTFVSQPENEDRRTLVITSDIPGAGEEAHRSLAGKIGDCGIGLLCCLGTHTKILCEEAARNRRSACFETDETRFGDILVRLMRPGDRILVLDGTAQGRFEALIRPMFGKSLEQ